MGAVHAIDRALDQPRSERAKILSQIPERPTSTSGGSREAQERAAQLSASILREALCSARLTYGDLGRALGVATSTAANHCTAGEARGLTLAKLIRAGWSRPTLLHEVATRLLELVAERSHDLSPERHHRLVHRELGEVAAALDEALADNVITADEARQLDRELADVERQVRAWRQDLQRRYGLR